MSDHPNISREWKPPVFDDVSLNNTAVVVLNTEMENPPEFVRRLWDKSQLRVVVDGGANRWHSYVKRNALDDLKVPDFITGDMDSAEPAVVKYFVSLGSKLIHTPDQDKTDFTKAIEEVVQYFAKNCISLDSIIVMVDMHHRVDHFLSNIHTLFSLKSKESAIDQDIYLLGRNVLTWLLPAGMHRIHVPDSLTSYPEKNYVGFFPLGSACAKCTTTGFKWNLCEQKMEMGGIISSSNTFNGDPFITISNSSPLLLTTTLGYEDNF